MHWNGPRETVLGLGKTHHPDPVLVPNLIFDSYDHILSVCRDAWNKLVALPETIRSVGSRAWAHPS